MNATFTKRSLSCCKQPSRGRASSSRNLRSFLYLRSKLRKEAASELGSACCPHARRETEWRKASWLPFPHATFPSAVCFVLEEQEHSEHYNCSYQEAERNFSNVSSLLQVLENLGGAYNYFFKVASHSP